MPNPFNDKTYDHRVDLELIEDALAGNSTALENLVKRHQHYIYNVALKMVLSPFVAEDITQEVLIKMVTKLSQFAGKSSFRTWLYRITFNHFLKMKKYWLEESITSFADYGQELDQIEAVELSPAQQLAQRELIEEAKLSCMSGMLLCLSREQRLVYILGELFEADHRIGSELLDISKANFRKRLERARRDLSQFMNNKCGLTNAANPCRCARKTRGFIKAGWVDSDRMKFNTDYLRTIGDTIAAKNAQLDDLLAHKTAVLQRDTPFQEKDHAQGFIRTLLGNSRLKDIFNLN